MTQEEDEFWNAQLTSARRGQLETVRKAATTWSAIFASTTGIFGAITFAGGAPKFEDLANVYELPLRTLYLSTLALALLATLFSGAASGRLPRVERELTAQSMRSNTRRAAVRARTLLAIGMWAGLLAVLTLLVGSAFIVLGRSGPQEAFVIHDGLLSCGALSVKNNSNVLLDGQRVLNVTEVRPTTRCPN